MWGLRCRELPPCPVFQGARAGLSNQWAQVFRMTVWPQTHWIDWDEDKADTNDPPPPQVELLSWSSSLYVCVISCSHNFNITGNNTIKKRNRKNRDCAVKINNHGLWAFSSTSFPEAAGSCCHWKSSYIPSVSHLPTTKQQTDKVRDSLVNIVKHLLAIGPDSSLRGWWRPKRELKAEWTLDTNLTPNKCKVCSVSSWCLKCQCCF